LPVIDRVARDYQDTIVFVAIAGRGELEATRKGAKDLFTDNLLWGMDDSIWGLYGVPGQPASILVIDDVIVDLWFGELPEAEMRKRLDALVALTN